MSHTTIPTWNSSDSSDEEPASQQVRKWYRSAFSINLMKNYGSKDKKDPTHLWSPMLGEWAPEFETIKTPIFTLFGPQTHQIMACPFPGGEDPIDDINRASNGLFLPSSISELFERYKIIIVPHSDGKHQQHEQQQQKEKAAEAKALKPQEWKSLVLDCKQLRDCSLPVLGENGKVADLHERKLVFQPGHPFRPSALYLYLHYLQAMLRFVEQETAKEEEGEVEVEEVDGVEEVERMIKMAGQLAGFDKADWWALQEEIDCREIIILAIDRGSFWPQKCEHGRVTVEKERAWAPV